MKYSKREEYHAGFQPMPRFSLEAEEK